MRDATRLDRYFNNESALFLIPLYQRKYSWKKKHCERLFEDLVKVHEQNLHSHFFGSIVSIKDSEVEDDLLIIDGQQRLTTISLLVLAAINAVKNGYMKCEDKKRTEKAHDSFLYASYRKGVERKIKLCPIEEDRQAYDKLFENDEKSFIPAERSEITSNYLYLYNWIKKCGDRFTFDDLLEAIGKLIIIDICLDSQDNPQLIFESLNSCGKDLEEADKVRNYLLMSESKPVQEEYYRKYWSKIEGNTDGEPTMFIRDYLTIKNNVISSLDELYFDFKKYHEDKGITRECLLQDMLKYSTYYREVGKGETQDDLINRKLKQLASIGSNTGMPFYMLFFDYAKTNGLGQKEIYEVLDVIENYWARRIICLLPSNAMNKIFALLHSDIMRVYREHRRRGVEMPVSYAEVLKYILIRKQGTGGFPSDNSVKEEFPKRKIYKISTGARCFLFERMENKNSKEYNETIVQKMSDGSFSIEHIMPQHLSVQWKKELGPTAEQIHERYLHTFANLTLTGYNQEYGNRPYIEKWSGYTIKKKNRETNKDEEVRVNGFKDSHFNLSDYMKSHQNWTEVELEERGKLLLNDFLQLWPMINSSYEPLEKNLDIVSLDDDDIDLTGRKIVGYRFRGERHQVNKWKEMLVGVCKTLYAENQLGMIFLAEKNTNLYAKPQSSTSMVAEDCHVCTSSNTRAKKAVLLSIFKELSVSPSDLEIELMPAEDNDDSVLDLED